MFSVSPTLEIAWIPRRPRNAVQLELRGWQFLPLRREWDAGERDQLGTATGLNAISSDYVEQVVGRVHAGVRQMPGSHSRRSHEWCSLDDVSSVEGREPVTTIARPSRPVSMFERSACPRRLSKFFAGKHQFFNSKPAHQSDVI